MSDRWFIVLQNCVQASKAAALAMSEDQPDHTYHLSASPSAGSLCFVINYRMAIKHCSTRAVHPRSQMPRTLAEPSLLVIVRHALSDSKRAGDQHSSSKKATLDVGSNGRLTCVSPI